MDAPGFVYIEEGRSPKTAAVENKLLVWKRAFDALGHGEPFLVTVRSSSVALPSDEGEYGEVSLTMPTFTFVAVKNKDAAAPNWQEGDRCLVFPVDRYARSDEGKLLLFVSALTIDLVDPVRKDSAREVRVVFGAESIHDWVCEETKFAADARGRWNDLVTKIYRMAEAVGYGFKFPDFLTVIKGRKCAGLIKRLADIAADGRITPTLKGEAKTIISKLEGLGVKEEVARRYISLELEARATLDEIVPKV